jgi:restriction system protein
MPVVPVELERADALRARAREPVVARTGTVYTMTTIWGVHNDQPQLDLVANGFISIGWSVMGDLRVDGNDKEAMKHRVAAAYPHMKPGAVPGTAGTLLAFAYRMQVGDLVIYPYKPDSTLNFGRIEGDYYHDAAASLHPNRRNVAWLKTGVPRTTFSQTARYEVGSAVTVFQVKNHAQEFLEFIEGSQPPGSIPPATVAPEAAVEAAANEPNAVRIETYTRDFIIETLMRELEGVQFEYFVAHLLEAMGYRTQVTQASGDGGFDIIAHRDPLGLEPPIIKVQCKRTTGSMGGPDVQRLTGTLAPGGSELGLFVTLGSYSKDAQNLGRTRQDLRLINGNELVDLVFEHYGKFKPEYKRLLPMRSVYVVDREPEGT